jgi:hypothetical protein
MGKIGFAAAVVAMILLCPLATGDTMKFLANGTWQSAVYALWDSSVSVRI